MKPSLQFNIFNVLVDWKKMYLLQDIFGYGTLWFHEMVTARVFLAVEVAMVNKKTKHHYVLKESALRHEWSSS